MDSYHFYSSFYVDEIKTIRYGKVALVQTCNFG
jgi:hypothetical protein